MHDNVRVYFTNKAKFEQIIKSNYEFNCTINSSDIKNDNVNYSIYPIKGQIGTMTYVINKDKAYIENSLHKYYNSKVIGKNINYDDFSYCDIIQALDDFNQWQNNTPPQQSNFGGYQAPQQQGGFYNGGHNVGHQPQRPNPAPQQPQSPPQQPPRKNNGGDFNGDLYGKAK